MPPHNCDSPPAMRMKRVVNRRILPLRSGNKSLPRRAAARATLRQLSPSLLSKMAGACC
jgi:hypothetical protein